MDGQTDFVPYQGRCPASPLEIKERTLLKTSKGGQGIRWPFDAFVRLVALSPGSPLLVSKQILSYRHYFTHKCHKYFVLLSSQ